MNKLELYAVEILRAKNNLTVINQILLQVFEDSYNLGLTNKEQLKK
jgi:hypothetical protein